MSIYIKQNKNNLSNYISLKDNVYVSKFEGITLHEYVKAMTLVCSNLHKRRGCKCLHNCEGLLNVANIVNEEGFIKLKDAAELCSPNVKSPTHARRKMLRMPCAVIGTGSLLEGTSCLYLVEKQSPATLYLWQSLLKEACIKKQTNNKGLTKEDMKKLLNLAESESERKRLKYAVVKSSGISSTKAKAVYGFDDMTSKINDVEKAMEEACAIRQAIEDIANTKEKSILLPLGISESSESGSDTESETDCESSSAITDSTCLPNNRKDNSDEEVIPARESMLKDLKENEFGYNSDSSSEITSESESSEAEIWALGVTSALDERGKILIRKRRAAMRRKTARTIKKRLAEKRLSGRRRSKKVGTLISQFPNIGKDIDDFVKESGAGADAWRRTGALTFDGNRRVKKKATFKRIQEHLQEKYNRKISYGTVIQLCIARNKRRKSAVRCRGVANVLSKRARKGFNIRYNPDTHWSAAFHRGLEEIQYKDGTNIINIGRDDQAGFRLDTMATHKQHPTLCVKGMETTTTRNDYVNKYPSNLQTTSYNFPFTTTTGEVCAGMVKAPGVHAKNAAQHYADLQMLEENQEIREVFWNSETQERKEIECARVDGSFDEGPSHCEVQYWWTVRHLVTSCRMTLVTSRNSGASYRNRVELQNGSLALGHAGLFIPSTLNGSCISGGNIDQDLLRKHLDAAIDVYISRVNKTPCAGTVINLYKGADSKAYQEENEFF